MKRFKCHKVVEAAEIKHVRFSGVDTAIESRAPYSVFIHDDAGNTHQMVPPDGFFARGVPERGDYLVRYEPDGYLSWSPKAVFEAGYSPE